MAVRGGLLVRGLRRRGVEVGGLLTATISTSPPPADDRSAPTTLGLRRPRRDRGALSRAAGRGADAACAGAGLVDYTAGDRLLDEVDEEDPRVLPPPPAATNARSRRRPPPASRLPFLTGADGKTLYIFKKDTQGTGKSACNGECAASWPPFSVGAGEQATAGDGVTATKISTVTRDDGSMQVAYAAGRSTTTPPTRRPATCSARARAASGSPPHRRLARGASTPLLARRPAGLRRRCILRTRGAPRRRPSPTVFAPA